MEINGNYKYDSQYNPEIYTLCGLSALLLISVISCLIYYKMTFIDKKLNFNAPEVLVNILLSSGLMSGFLCVFYFTYLDKVEKDVLLNNIKGVFNDITPSINLPANVVSIIKNLINYVNTNYVPDSTRDDNAINNNQKIRNKAIMIFGGGFALIMIVALAILIIKKASIAKIIGINLLLLASIALTEFMFATFFVSNYSYLDLNNVIYDGLAVYQESVPNLNNASNPALPVAGFYTDPFYTT